MTIDGNVTNIENCIYTLMSNCKQPTEGGTTSTSSPSGPSAGYQPDYNGEYIPSVSANYYEDSGEIDPDYYDNYPNGQYKRGRSASKATQRCKDMQTGKLVACGQRGTRAARDQTSWIVEQAGPAGERAWSVDMVTDESGQTAGLIIKVGRKMNVEVLNWDDLRINGVKMSLPFQNSEMVAEVFCGIVQITTTIGFTVTMDKDGQVECSAPDNTEENTPVYVPPSWTDKSVPDRNDGNCEEVNDCLDEPFCRNHPKCDPRCKGDGCNHPNCGSDPRCPSESPEVKR